MLCFGYNVYVRWIVLSMSTAAGDNGMNLELFDNVVRSHGGRKLTSTERELNDAALKLVLAEEQRIQIDPELLDTDIPYACEHCGEEHRDHDNYRQCIASATMQLDRLKMLIVDLAGRPNGWTYREVEELRRENRELKRQLGLESTQEPVVPVSMDLFAFDQAAA
jgi:hypothetical protein